MMTTNKITTGEFEVLWNGKPTRFRIINGNAGMSGTNTQNVYGIVTEGAPTKWIGSLAKCKKNVAAWLAKTNG